MKSLPSLRIQVLIFILSITPSVWCQNDISEVEYNIYDTDEKQQIQFFCATIKLCGGYDYSTIFVENTGGRYINPAIVDNNGQPLSQNDPCIKNVPFPFLNPLEYYAHEFEKDKRIAQNRTNAFKLRALRKEIKEKYGSTFQKKLNQIDLENLISYDAVYASIQDYDFDTNTLKIRYSIKDVRFMNNSQTINFPALSDQNSSFYYHDIKMPEDRAEKIYNHYAELKPYSNSGNPPFYLNAKTTFAFRFYNEPQFKNQIHAVVKKMEFFIKEKEPKDIQLRLKHKDRLGKEQKIGEILFDDAVYLNRFKQPYQMATK